MKRTIVFAILLLDIFVSFTMNHLALSAHAAQAANDAEQIVTENYYISDTPVNSWITINDYDATDQYVFFAYSDPPWVEAYDLDGNFLFALGFQSRKNGAMDIRCQDGLLYVSTRHGNVFIFDGKNLVDKMSRDQAAEAGYVSYWFAEKAPRVLLDGFALYHLDETGEIQSEIPVSVTKTFQIYKQYSFLYGLVLILLVEVLRLARKRIFRHRHLQDRGAL